MTPIDWKEFTAKEAEREAADWARSEGVPFKAKG